ncbi:Uncharacterized conserved protein, DUF433 family [Dyadobacter sp. SG02]|nr:Uncharacterized conserved protein, DUF433 family [Dyadobacter sp. SG02]
MKRKKSMGIQEIVTIDPEILSGQPVFSGTRVPIDTLFDHLEAGVSLDDFLDDFPSVTRDQAVALLEAANRLLSSKHIEPDASNNTYFELTKLSPSIRRVLKKPKLPAGPMAIYEGMSA